MLAIPEIFFAFGATILLAVISLLLGSGLQWIANRLGAHKADSKELSLFWKLLTGTFMLISLFAILSTKGITLLLLVPFLLFFFVKQKLANTPVQHSVSASQNGLFLLVTLIFNFLFYLWAINSFSPDYVSYVSGDFNIYYRIAQRLNSFGIESLNLDPIYSAHYAAPYHYGDIWMYAFISKFVSTNPSVVFLVAFTHFSIIFINGIYTYAYERFQPYLSNKKAFFYLLLFAGLFTGFNSFFPRFIIPSAEPYTLSVMNWSKVLVPSCFLISLLLLAKDKSWWAFVLLAMIGGLCFINALPAIFMAVFLMLTVNLIRKNISPKQWVIYNLCYVLLTVIFIVVLYKVIPSVIGVKAQEATGVEIKRVIDIKMYLTTAIKIFIGGWFQLFVLSPYIIVFLIALVITGKFKGLKQRVLGLGNDLLFMIFMVLSGLCCWALLHPFAPDAVQFYTNVLAPIYAIAISFIIMYLLYVSKNKVLSILSLFIVVACLWVHKGDVFFTNKHDRNEWNSLKTFLQKKDLGHKFVSIKPIGHFNSFFDKNTIYFMPLGFLNYLWPDYHNYSLNAPFIPVNETSLYANEERIEINLAPFTIYYKEKLKQGTQSAADIMNSFVQEQHIGYISVSKDTLLPECFRGLVKDSLDLEKANFMVYRLK